MDYNEIESKYIKAKIQGNYQFRSAIEVKKVLGYDFRTIRGFKDLTDLDKALAEQLICSCINGHGLKSREDIRPTNIKREIRRFKVTFKDGEYSYLFDNGSIG